MVTQGIYPPLHLGRLRGDRAPHRRSLPGPPPESPPLPSPPLPRTSRRQQGRARHDLSGSDVGGACRAVAHLPTRHGSPHCRPRTRHTSPSPSCPPAPPQLYKPPSSPPPHPSSDSFRASHNYHSSLLVLHSTVSSPPISGARSPQPTPPLLLFRRTHFSAL